MRPIDADAIITALLYDEEHEETQEIKMSIADFLDSHTVEGCPQNGGWISVKDGLPNDSKPVYVWIGIGSSLRSGIPFVGQYNIFSGGWMIYGLNADKQEIIKITHWMPLPEPPEEDKDNEL